MNSPSDQDHSRRRLALTRVLIWAEGEASDMSEQEAAARLREAIAALHSKPG